MTSPSDYLELLEESWDEPVVPRQPVCLHCAWPMPGWSVDFSPVLCEKCQQELEKK